MGALILVNFYYHLIGGKKGRGESAVITGAAVVALAVNGLDRNCRGSIIKNLKNLDSLEVKLLSTRLYLAIG